MLVYNDKCLISYSGWKHNDIILEDLNIIISTNICFILLSILVQLLVYIDQRAIICTALLPTTNRNNSILLNIYANCSFKIPEYIDNHDDDFNIYLYYLCKTLFQTVRGLKL